MQRDRFVRLRLFLTLVVVVLGVNVVRQAHHMTASALAQDTFNPSQESGPVKVAADVDFTCDDVTEIPQIECEALVALYNSTDGDNWRNNRDWLETNTPCSWFGITCEEGSIVEVGGGNWYSARLEGNRLTGNIPPELGNLSNLRQLLLARNQLSGNIPAELGNLTSLGTLELYSNQLSGSIPSGLGNLVSLKTLNLGNNQLTGSIPPALGDLAHLRVLWLYNNQLSGSIPPELGNLVNLEGVPTRTGTWNAGLNLSNNQLSGSIPQELGNLVNLRGLRLSNNQLSGNIPPELGNLINLGWSYYGLDLSNNQLSGSVPSELGNLTNSSFTLNLSNNPLSGALPRNLMNVYPMYFMFQDTGLCEPGDDAFQGWLGNILLVKSTDIICEESCYDLNHDNQVDVTDIQLAAQQWRELLISGERHYDITGNGQVTVLDIQAVAMQLGQTCPLPG